MLTKFVSAALFSLIQNGQSRVPIVMSQYPIRASGHIDALAYRLGYQSIGGMSTNRVYRYRERQEVLKIAVADDPITLEYARAQFQRCLAASRIYASYGLMPEVFAIGDNFHATGLPWLREQYIATDNLGAAYLGDPLFWTLHAPQEIVRIAMVMTMMHREDITATWHEKLAGMTCPPGSEDIYGAVVRAGEHLAERYATGHIIHGDLQFGNILVHREGEASRLWLIDWEVSEVMPLGYEFAMLYTFLLGPEAQVEEQFQRRYGELKPLRAFWAALAPLLFAELGISEDELKDSVVFRMGNGWLYQLAQATQRGDASRAAELERALRNLVSGRCFDILPYPWA